MNIRPISPALALKAQSDLGETPERIQNDIFALRDWIEKQPHLTCRKDDQFFLTFLRCCCFNVEQAKKRIDSFLTFKSINPEVFKNRKVDMNVIDILKSGLISIPPRPMPNDGPRLLISHFSQFNPKKHSLCDVFKVRFMLFDLLAFEDDITAISGIELIFDLKNCTLSQALYLDPVILRKSFIYQDQCIPLRIKRIHIINMKRELQGVVKLARSILSSSKSAFEILLHEKESDLFEYIPKEYMTTEYGGNNGSKEVILEEWAKNLIDHTRYFEEDSLFGTNEKLRKDPRVQFTNDFGVEGNFRKLEFD